MLNATLTHLLTLISASGRTVCENAEPFGYSHLVGRVLYLDLLGITIPEVSVSNGEHITLVHEDWRAIGDGDTIQLGVVGLTQRDDIDLSNKDDNQYTTISSNLLKNSPLHR